MTFIALSLVPSLQSTILCSHFPGRLHSDMVSQWCVDASSSAMSSYVAFICEFCDCIKHTHRFGHIAESFFGSLSIYASVWTFEGCGLVKVREGDYFLAALAKFGQLENPTLFVHSGFTAKPTRSMRSCRRCLR